jgi:hypothetical protein
MAEPKDLGFLPDGRERALQASEAKIKAIEARIRARYAEQLAKAGVLERLHIEARIRRGVKAKIEKMAPSDGLY